MASRVNLLRNPLSFRPGNKIYAHPNRIGVSFSSRSSRNPDQTPDFSPNLSAAFVDQEQLDDTGDGYSRVQEMCVKKNVNLMIQPIGETKNPAFVVPNDESNNAKSEDDEPEARNGFEGDHYLSVLDMFNPNQQQRERFKSIELNEDELRNPLVKEMCKLIDLRSEWNPEHETELRHLLRSVKPQQVCLVLRSQVDERVALNFFYWADRQWRYRHHPVVYYTMLQILSKTKLCQGAKRVLRLMLRRGISCSPEAFGYVMISFSRAGDTKKAMEVLFRMQRVGIAPDFPLCNTCIYVLVKGKRLDKAMKFLNKMQAVGIEPSPVTYNCLIKGFCDMGRIEVAIKMIDEMPLRGCVPDKVSYYTVMGFLCKEKRIKEVRVLMGNMLEKSELLPDQVTYNMLIHALSKNGHSEEALEFLKEAEDKGFLIDKVGYSAVIHSFCREGCINKATELVNKMSSKGCEPDVVTYTSVMNGLCHVGQVDEARKLVQKLYKLGCRPNTVSYTTLLNGLCRIGRTTEAREMLGSSEEDWWVPNGITYSVIMHGLHKEGKVSEACDLVKEMTKKGFYPTAAEINLLIQSLCRENRVNDAKKFMEECLRAGCAVNAVNFTSVIHGFCQKDDLDAALSLLDDMYLSNRYPDTITYTIVISALGKKGRIDESIQLTKKMLSMGLVPTPVTYRSVIHWFCQHGRVEDLLKLLERLLSRMQNKTAYNQVIEKLCSLGNLDEAYGLLGKVLKTASRIDANTCHVLMESYLIKGLPLFSYKVACRMFNRNLIPDLKLCEEVSKRLLLEGNDHDANKLMLRFVERGCILPQPNRKHNVSCDSGCDTREFEV